MKDQITEVSDILHAAETNKTPCSPIRNIIGANAIEEAYKVQNVLTNKRVANGARLVGRKIGLTSFAVQKQLGVNQPDYGALFNDMEVMEGGTLNWNECMQPKVEAEIAFYLKHDLNTYSSIANVIDAIEFAVPCIEIVGSRIKDWDIKIADTIADNASASHFVIGHNPKKITEIDVVNCKMELFKNGQLESEGVGKACMGSPINATWWLANKLLSLGQPLLKGNLVLAGALGPMVVAAPNDHFEARFGGLGKVSINFGKVD
jgi:2-keto-4-pentenoate hydratase